MAYAAVTNNPQAVLFDRLVGMFGFDRENAAKHRVYRKTVSELGELTNRDLADLGIARSEIRRIAWEAAYGPAGTH